MEMIFSTEQVHPRDRFDYWHSIACSNLVDHNSQPKCRSSFEAKIEIGQLGIVGLILFHNSPMQISHTQHHIAYAKSDHLFVCRQLSGMLFLEQETRGGYLEAGDLTLLDPLLPYEGRFSKDSQTLVLKVPRRELEARVGKTREMVSRVIKPVRAEDSLTSSVSALLPSLGGKMCSISAEMVGNHILDLIAVSLVKATEGGCPRLSCAKALVLSNIRTVVEARLADPRLDAQAVANAVGVSVRYANDILAKEGTSVVRFIQARRLARCRCALEDPTQAHRTVSEIAFGWGFSDLTHFGRRFKQAFGILPSEAQALAKQSGHGGGF
jgi:AraC-like DNA-binding protein